eukprot:401211_1
MTTTTCSLLRSQYENIPLLTCWHLHMYRYKQLVKDNVKRTIRAVKPSVTDQELEVVFQQEDGVSRVLEAAVLKEGDPIHVANVLKEVQDTYEDVRKLESSIIELHNMFMDLALLVIIIKFARTSNSTSVKCIYTTPTICSLILFLCVCVND